MILRLNGFLLAPFFYRSLIQSLQGMTVSAGWNINHTIIEDLLDEIPKDPKELERQLCNVDIRKYGSPALSDINKDSAFLNGPIVLQIYRHRNISHPQIGDHFHGGITRIFFTDGHGSISALMFDEIKGLNSNTPPGTKVLLSGKIPIETGFLILSRNQVTVLGGKVEALIEKWILEKNATKGVGRKGQNSAPSWVSFGNKKNNKESNTRNFKANDFINNTTKKEQQEDDTFLKQRKENIELASEDAAKKVFAAPKIAPPPVAAGPAEHSEREKPQKVRPEKPRGGRRRKNSEDADVPAEFARPSAPSTLLDFMTSGGIISASSAPVMHQPKEKTTLGSRDNSNRKPRGGGAAARFNNTRNNRDNEPRRYNDSKGRSNFQPNTFNERDGRNPNKQGESADLRHDRNPIHQGPSRPPKTPNPTYQREMKQPPKHFEQGGFPGLEEDIVHKMSNMHIGPPVTFRRSKPFHDKQNKRPGYSKGMPVWKVGQQCKAPWTDGGYYPATIVSLGPADMCTVRYDEYGNVSTVPQAVLIF